MSEYSSRLTGEQFLFYEIRILAGLLCDGYSSEKAIAKIENLFQFPTERKIKPIANACLRRIQALKIKTLVNELAHASFGVAKQINLYAIMRQNIIVWDFMTTVLPHRKLQLTDDCRVLCDGEPTDGTENRRKILNTEHNGNVAVTYKTLLSMTKAEHDEFTEDAEVIYIYHNTIDAVGDKAATEDCVFEACEDAITEIKSLVRRITNIFKGTNILITADHGFLYSYKPLQESDKTEKSFITGEIAELERRYVLVKGECTAEHMQRIPMSHMNSELTAFAPLQNICIKKAGGGMNYVHGGISLQECVVPVIEFKNMRRDSKNFVGVKKVELQLISQSRKVSNSIFSLDFYQKEAVSGKLVAAEYEIYMSDAAGKPVSDRQIVIADKTSTNGSERVMRTRFTLKNMEFKKTETYYLTIIKKGTPTAVNRIEFTIDITFANDFDF